MIVATLGCGPNGSLPEASEELAGQAPPTPEEESPVVLEPEVATVDEEVTVKILDYAEIQDLIASHQGKHVIMDCWNTSCLPCLKEFPHLVELHQQYGNDKLACVSLSFDYDGLGQPEDVVPKVLEFLKSQNATFDNVVCSEEADVLYGKMKLSSVPAVYVYSPAGEMIRRFDHSVPGEEFTYADVKAFLEAQMATAGGD